VDGGVIAFNHDASDIGAQGDRTEVAEPLDERIDEPD
jgi:hypothetical protein